MAGKVCNLHLALLKSGRGLGAMGEAASLVAGEPMATFVHGHTLQSRHEAWKPWARPDSLATAFSDLGSGPWRTPLFPAQPLKKKISTLPELGWKVQKQCPGFFGRYSSARAVYDQGWYSAGTSLHCPIFRHLPDRALLLPVERQRGSNNLI
ncbi:hypothetical protein NL676_017704 [Syzygium grande]|nr:hypothetical protein NL676_017704 [Syzygium grande]